MAIKITSGNTIKYAPALVQLNGENTIYILYRTYYDDREGTTVYHLFDLTTNIGELKVIKEENDGINGLTYFDGTIEVSNTGSFLLK